MLTVSTVQGMPQGWQQNQDGTYAGPQGSGGGGASGSYYGQQQGGYGGGQQYGGQQYGQQGGYYGCVSDPKLDVVAGMGLGADLLPDSSNRWGTAVSQYTSSKGQEAAVQQQLVSVVVY